MVFYLLAPNVVEVQEEKVDWWQVVDLLQLFNNLFMQFFLEELLLHNYLFLHLVLLFHDVTDGTLETAHQQGNEIGCRWCCWW